jgi:hypothetical protein
MYYLYEHKTLDDKTFYIGKGTYNKKHSYGGYSRAYSKQQRTNDWKEIAKSGYKINIIFQSDDLNSVLEKEDELWETCTYCVNKQTNKKFKQYIVEKINDEVAILYVFGKTYIVLKNGQIFNFVGKKLKLSTHNNGYTVLSVSNGEKYKKNFYIHRFVAELFVPNPLNLPNVNHIDLDRSNNNADNLKWCTQEENVNYSVNLGSYKMKDKIKKVLQFNKNGSLIKEWNRASEAAREFNCVEELIQQACQQKNMNKALTARGFIWIYKNDYENNNRMKFNKIMNKYETYGII